MNKIELDKVRDRGKDIAEILSLLKSLGFNFNDYQRGYLTCLMEQCRTPTNGGRDVR